jgi:DNA (cytosine-5)-methyltransferase 1
MNKLPGFEPPVDRVYPRTTLSEIFDRPSNGLVAVSTFSGGGGSSLGLRMAGWTVPVAVEFVAAARETYWSNFPDTFIDRRDVRNISGAEILDRIGLERNELDLLEGSPPCAAFSNAGAGDEVWGEIRKYSDTRQRVDDLFLEWIRLVDEIRPRAILAENVPSMLYGDASIEFTQDVRRRLSQIGYSLEMKVLNAAWFGVPQVRRRLIMVGFRHDLQDVGRFHFPSPTVEHPFTFREAMRSVELDDDDRSFIDQDTMPNALIPPGSAVERNVAYIRKCRDAGIEPNYAVEPCQRCGRLLTDGSHKIIRTTKDGVPVAATCEDGQDAHVLKDFHNLHVVDPDRPVKTILVNAGNYGSQTNGLVHPVENRKLVPSEELALAGFPSDYVLTGSMNDRHERIGRTVTPPVYEAVGRSIAEMLA